MEDDSTNAKERWFGGKGREGGGGGGGGEIEFTKGDLKLEVVYGMDGYG